MKKKLLFSGIFEVLTKIGKSQGNGIELKKQLPSFNCQELFDNSKTVLVFF